MFDRKQNTNYPDGLRSRAAQISNYRNDRVSGGGRTECDHTFETEIVNFDDSCVRSQPRHSDVNIDTIQLNRNRISS